MNPSTLIICDAYEPHLQLKDVYMEDLKKHNIELMAIPSGCSSQLNPILYGVGELFQVSFKTARICFIDFLILVMTSYILLYGIL